MDGSRGTYVRQEKGIQIFLGRFERKRALGRPRRRREDNIKMCLWDRKAGTALIWLRTGGGR
jgi:hypothetical protein